MNQTRLGRTPDRNLVRASCLRAAAVSSAVAMTLALLPVSAVPAAGRSTAAIPDVTVLFGRAVTTVRNTQRPTYAHAVVLEADGITRGGQCSTMGCSGGRGVKDASGVVSWRFVFDNQSSHSRFASATVAYGPAPKAFGKVNGNPSPFLEDVVIAKAPRMTLSRAVTLLRRAGHSTPFFNVTLRNPLGPKASKPLYIFGFAHGEFVAVNTVTNKVAPFG